MLWQLSTSDAGVGLLLRHGGAHSLPGLLDAPLAGGSSMGEAGGSSGEAGGSGGDMTEGASEWTTGCVALMCNLATAASGAAALVAAGGVHALLRLLPSRHDPAGAGAAAGGASSARDKAAVAAIENIAAASQPLAAAVAAAGGHLVLLRLLQGLLPMQAGNTTAAAQDAHSEAEAAEAAKAGARAVGGAVGGAALAPAPPPDAPDFRAGRRIAMTPALPHAVRGLRHLCALPAACDELREGGEAIRVVLGLLHLPLTPAVRCLLLEISVPLMRDRREEAAADGAADDDALQGVLTVLLGMHDALGARVVLLTLHALRAALSCAPRALEAAPAVLRTAELHAPHLLALLRIKPAAARRGAPARSEREVRLLHTASAACVGLLCAAPGCAALFSRLEADGLLLRLLPPPPPPEHSTAADVPPPAAAPLAVLRMVAKLQYRRLSQVAGATAPGSRSQAWTDEAAATEHEVAEALRLQLLAALRQLLHGALLPTGRARAAVWQLTPQLGAPAAAARAEAAMALDALCECAMHSRPLPSLPAPHRPLPTLPPPPSRPWPRPPPPTATATAIAGTTVPATATTAPREQVA